MKRPQSLASPMFPSRLKDRRILLSLVLLGFIFCHDLLLSGPPITREVDRILARCKSITLPAGPSILYDAASRLEKGSDRYVNGTAPTLIQNAHIWTGTNNGTEIIYGDILLDNGLIVALGHIPRDLLVKVKATYKTIETVDARGKWITPGLVDLHSHIGLSSAPYLKGAADTNSRKAPILPWLRSVDALNTHDASYQLAIAGGVTTAQILPGSANNIGVVTGGQSFLIKLRPTKERSAIAKILEPPETLVRDQPSDHLHWRHMKHACGENPSSVYSQTRMDSAWNFRQAYESARKVKDAQDEFCSRVMEIKRRSWRSCSLHKSITSMGGFPENLQWESLVDVLRGRVKLSVHCYEAVDLDAIVRLSNEFKFPISSLHHAGQTYLVPELLKQTWQCKARFHVTHSAKHNSASSRKKREAYRNSEFAPKILADNGIPVVMKSDHPVLNSRYLLYEAQQAHYYGLNANLALASVTSTPANAAGVGHRVGRIAVGFDADIAIWDSHPLALGATPVQVFIDGIAQIEQPHALVKPKALQTAPQTPNWNVESQQAVEFDGLPPLRGRKVRLGGDGVKFTGLKTAWMRDEDGHVHSMFDETTGSAEHSVVVRDGSIVLCSAGNAAGACDDARIREVVDLQGGSLAPGLTTFGSPIGLVEIRLEPSTTDGLVRDPLTGSVPAILGGDDAVIRAVDGLQFEGRNTLLAYRSGVTRAVTAPVAGGFLAGLSTTIDTGASSAVEKGAVIQEETALHVSVSLGLGVSVSTQIATLRKLLHESESSDAWARGAIPLVVTVDSADVMATLLNLKLQYESSSGNVIRLTFAGASEAHLLAEEIGKAGAISRLLGETKNLVAVLTDSLPGPPLSQESTLTALLACNAALESNGTISRREAIELATTRLDRALGVKSVLDLVAYRGGSIFDFESKVAGVVSMQRGTVEIF
ncbi:hypothetical protein D9615_008768 [Tricholomella constricta]|uniref:Amidohydrolase-related domain-containing protein n=1 Tax=Tricholomella constricta TaxID=117010 RepID=A0A8H5M210_9AGAR|nr:hypothetical protein D9615_008768 [Tricholomella constricta]